MRNIDMEFHCFRYTGRWQVRQIQFLNKTQAPCVYIAAWLRKCICIAELLALFLIDSEQPTAACLTKALKSFEQAHKGLIKALKGTVTILAQAPSSKPRC